MEGDPIVKFDVRGVTKGMQIRRSLLKSVPGSLLEEMFSGRHVVEDPTGEKSVYLDRDP